MLCMLGLSILAWCVRCSSNHSKILVVSPVEREASEFALWWWGQWKVTFDLFRAAGGKVEDYGSRVARIMGVAVLLLASTVWEAWYPKVVAELDPEQRWGITSVDGWVGQPRNVDVGILETHGAWIVRTLTTPAAFVWPLACRFFFGCFVSECVRRVRPVPERAVRSKELGQPGPGHHWRPGASAESHSLREYVYRVPQTHTHIHTHTYIHTYIYI